MKRIRVIPVLLLKDRGLVKTSRFGKPTYVGDPINAVKIFNRKEVDEIAVIDISGRAADEGPDVTRFADIASEAFMGVTAGASEPQQPHGMPVETNTFSRPAAWICGAKCAPFP